jgi:hypothetical protein
MIIDELFEAPQQCPECGGISFSDLILAEKKDACYHKVKASAKVWPSAYASGRLVQCRKKGAANYGNKSEGVAEAGFPGAPDVEMPPMNPSGDPQRDKLKQEYMDLHREIKSLVDLQYRSTSDEQKMQAKARIEQLNDRADQIKAILEPRQPPNEWQKKTYGFDDNWNKVNQGVAENTAPQLSVQQLATISDAALDKAYGYGRSTPGNTFGWQANLKSAAYAKQMIDQGVTDIEAISDAIHKGWNTTAQAFVQDPEQFDDTAKLAAAGKLEAKLQQRAQLMKQNYAQLPEEEKEKDRVVARALLQAIKGPQQQGMAEARRGQIPMTLNPGETDNLEPENIAGFRQLPAYKQGQAAQQKAGKQLIQKSPYTFQSDQDWAYRQGATDAQRAAMFANFGGTKPLTTEEGEQQKGADYRDPKEVDYDDEYDAMVARVKKLAGLGPMKTVYDPKKRQYRNMPTAQQPKK